MITRKPKDKSGEMKKTVNFKRPLPYWECTPIEYEDYKPFIELKSYIDKTLEELFKKEIDSGNGNVLDVTINTYAETAMKDLARQRIDHKKAIQDKVIQRAGTETRFKNALEDAKVMLEEKKIEVEELRQQYLL